MDVAVGDSEIVGVAVGEPVTVDDAVGPPASGIVAVTRLYMLYATTTDAVSVSGPEPDAGATSDPIVLVFELLPEWVTLVDEHAATWVDCEVTDTGTILEPMWKPLNSPPAKRTA